jgi:hypothetical protein
MSPCSGAANYLRQAKIRRQFDCVPLRSEVPMTRLGLVIASCFCVFTTTSALSDLRFEAGAACRIEIIDGPGGNHFTRWRNGQLAGADACMRIGQQVDYQNPSYPNRDVCVCVGPNRGSDQSRAVALCRDRGTLAGPSDSRALVWCDQVLPMAPCNTPLGEWNWVDGSRITFVVGGGATHSVGGQGTWTQTGNTIRIQWPRWNSTDVLTLSADGQQLAGQYGPSVTGTSTRLTPCQ